MGSRLFRRIHFAVYLGLVFIFYLSFYPFLFALKVRTPRQPGAAIFRIRKVIARLTAFLSGFRFAIQYEQPINWSDCYVICANHSSILDISALILTIKQKVVFIGKDSLLQLPVTGFFFRHVDIPVNRNSKISSYRAYRKSVQRLDQGISIAIFPEGGIEGSYPPSLQPFKNGAFRLAIEKGIPILPVVIYDTWKYCFDEGQYGSKPGKAMLKVLEPIKTKEMMLQDADKLKDRVFDLLYKELKSGERCNIC